ncbi:MAG: peptidylprolyl isomerase [Candidatus Sericytochromatia bacterium]
MKTTLTRLAVAGAMLFAFTGVADAATKAATLAEVNKAAGKQVQAGQRVRIETTKGTFEITLFPKAAPKTVANFVALAKKGFYNGTTFHRVIPGFVAQGGDPLSKKLAAGNPQIGTGGAEKNIPDEHGNGLSHLAGSVAMAHSSMPNSASSQFYVCFEPITHLNGGYTIFAQVTKGFDVVQKLQATERDGVPVQNVKPDKMIKVTVL